MKQLEPQFVSAPDGQKSQFVQVQRTDKVAMYKRMSPDGSVIQGYEVFEIHVTPAGTTWPNGTVEPEDRESYPGKSCFGKTASFCSTEQRAKLVFDAMVVKVAAKTQDHVKTGVPIENVPQVNPEPAIVVPVATVPPSNNPIESPVVPSVGGKKRGRKRLVELDNIKIPQEGEFTMKDLLNLNAPITQSSMYPVLMEMVENGEVLKVGEKKQEGQRGKASIVYKAVATAVV